MFAPVGDALFLPARKEGALKGLHFAVFGVGNSQWHTYQQFPREAIGPEHPILLGGLGPAKNRQPQPGSSVLPGSLRQLGMGSGSLE